MKVCMIVNSLLEFGGLEEFATNLAIGVQRQGCQVSVLSTLWVPPENQYYRSLFENQIKFIQLPKWLSLLLSDWETKEKFLSSTVWLLSPLQILLGIFVFLIRRKKMRESFLSARNWMRGQLMRRFIGPDWKQPFICLLLFMWRLRWRPDLIHIQGYTSSLLFLVEWAYAHKLPVIYEEHQTPDAQFDWWKDFKKSINKASMVIAVSEKSAQALRDVCGVTRPISTVYYMVPNPFEPAQTVNNQSKNNNGFIRITTPARLYVTKGLTYLLEAIPMVKAVHPDVQFRVYGDGPLRKDLLAHADRLGLDGQEIFIGTYTSRNELTNIMAQTDVFVMSSILEGLPVALLEALSYGKTVVVTPVGGIPEVIRDGINGLLCTPRDPKCLAEKINMLIENPDLRAKLGYEARKTYEEGPFHPNKVCARYIDIYQEVIAFH